MLQTDSEMCRLCCVCASSSSSCCRCCCRHEKPKFITSKARPPQAIHRPLTCWDSNTAHCSLQRLPIKSGCDAEKSEKLLSWSVNTEIKFLCHHHSLRIEAVLCKTAAPGSATDEQSLIYFNYSQNSSINTKLFLCWLSHVVVSYFSFLGVKSPQSSPYIKCSRWMFALNIFLIMKSEYEQ